QLLHRGCRNGAHARTPSSIAARSGSVTASSIGLNTLRGVASQSYANAASVAPIRLAGMYAPNALSQLWVWAPSIVWTNSGPSWRAGLIDAFVTGPTVMMIATTTRPITR